MKVVNVAQEVDGTVDHIFNPIMVGDAVGVYWVWSTSSGALTGTVDVYLSPDGRTYALSHSESVTQGPNVGYTIDSFAGFVELRWRAGTGGGTFNIVASINQSINSSR